MDSPKTQPRRWLWIAAWLLLTVYFVSPPREVYDQTLDKSNYATYAHFVTHGFQWGVDVMPMPGPLGFVLFGYCYSGELYGARLLGDLFLCAGFSALLLQLCFRARGGALRWAWLAVLLLTVPFIDDLLLDATVLLSAICVLLAPPGKPDRWTYLGTILLAFISLIKGTHVIMCVAALGTLALLGLLERRPARVLRPAVVFIVAFLLFFLLARQNPLNLGAYLIATSQLASGYSLTMGLEEDPFFFQTGVALAAGLVAVLGWCILFGVRSLRTSAALLFICLFAFLKWKHGYVRADGHVYIFFGSAAIIAMTAWLIGFSAVAAPAEATAEVSSKWRSRTGLGLVTLVTGFAVIGCTQFWLGRFALVAKTVPERLSSHLSYLVRPSKTRAKLDRQLFEVRIAADAPQLRNEIGDGTTDFFGNEEGLILLNHLKYHPRPMGGGTFNVVNSWLQRRNEAFILSAKTAPAWQILKLAPFDDRLPTGDDGLALRAILDCYSPVMMQREYLLLKRVRDRPAAARPELIATVNVRPGQRIDVPQVATDKMVLFSLHTPLSVFGRARSFVYRPPLLEGRFFTANFPTGRTFVLKPAILEDPMILSPFLADTTDVLNLFGGGATNPVRALTLDAAPGFATDEFSISFFTVPRPPRPTDTDIAEILTYEKYPLYNRDPVDLVTEKTGIHEINNEPITVVHAPGSITWNLEPHDQQLIFSYGLVPKAYLNGGTTDGVEFNVEVLWPPTDGRVVFKHMIRPRTVHQDRGMHRARVWLPPYEPGAQLRIRTHPGPDNDGANDQSYVSRVNLKSGPLNAEQFNGLGVIPANGRLPHDSVASVGEQPVFLLHAPNELILDVPTGAKTAHAEIGLLPGAYTNGGNSDGVGYTVFAEAPGGTRVQLWKRFVDPVHEASDRGVLPVSIELPALAAGSHLVITTDIGSHGDRSWDQSYIARVRFE